MIICLLEGGIGNQLFQINYALSVRKSHERIIFSGLCGAKELIERPKNSGFIFSKKDTFLSKVARKVLPKLARWKILSSYLPEKTSLKGYTVESGKILPLRGLISGLVCVRGFYQWDAFVAEGIHFKLKNTEKQKKQIRNRHGDHYNAVQVRLGDYLDWSVYGKSPVLPDAYYAEGIEALQNTHGEKNVVVISDDPSLAHQKKCFRELNVSDGCMIEDFYLLMYADNAVISPSTFAWWARKFALGVTYYPKYWAGFSSKLEYAPGISPNFGTPIEINLNLNDA